MDAHLRQQFDLLLLAAADRLAERTAQRCRGTGQALERLRTDPDGEGVWLGDFVDAVFAENCLDNPAGACFVLQATHKRAVAATRAGRVGDVLITMAKAVFAELLTAKATESLSLAGRYG